MSYPPKIHQDDNRDHLLEVIKTFPLATVISVNENTPFITHLPLIWDGKKLIGHLDKYNPQTEFLRDTRDVTVIFSGPQCYISPSIYTTTQLPTWNYVKVHLKGTVQAVTNTERIKEGLINMTRFLEKPDQKFVLEPENTQMKKYLPFIHGFEITITKWEGKFKLSQDKNPHDMENAREELIKQNQKSLQTFLKKIL